MSKKGFTLIELLAVILILGIIALIAIPTVNNILKESRQGAFNASMQNIIKAAEEKCLTESMKGNTVRQFVFTNGKVSPELDVKGDLPKSGIITLNENCEANATLTDGDRKYELTYEGSTVEECNSNNCSFTSNIIESDNKYQCFNFDEETGTILKYDGTNPVCQGDVYIPAMINNVPVTTINALAFINPQIVKCKNGGVITEYPGTYIPKEEDGFCYGSGFSNNYSYNKIDMTDAGYLTEIGNHAFYYANILEVNFNENLRIIRYGAFSANATKKIILPKNLEKMEGYAFDGSEIEELVINNKLKVIEEYAFYSNALKEINIPEGVEYIEEGAFKWGGYDSNLVINISDTVKGIGSTAFLDVGAIKVNMGKNVEYIGRAAFVHNKLTSITLPEGLKEIGTGAFNNNRFTVNQFIFNRNSDGTENKKSINSFAGSKGNVVVPDGVEELGAESFIYSEITGVTLPEGLKYIRNNAFERCNLTSITIPSTVEVIEQKALLKEYSYNKSLTSIINKTGRSFDWSSITSSNTANQVFETGTVTHQNNNITVSK